MEKWPQKEEKRERWHSVRDSVYLAAGFPMHCTLRPFPVLFRLCNESPSTSKFMQLWMKWDLGHELWVLRISRPIWRIYPGNHLKSLRNSKIIREIAYN
jgi:hypothetical protein